MIVFSAIAIYYLATFRNGTILTTNQVNAIFYTQIIALILAIIIMIYAIFVFATARRVRRVERAVAESESVSETARVNQLTGETEMVTTRTVKDTPVTVVKDDISDFDGDTRVIYTSAPITTTTAPAYSQVNPNGSIRLSNCDVESITSGPNGQQMIQSTKQSPDSFFVYNSPVPVPGQVTTAFYQQTPQQVVAIPRQQQPQAQYIVEKVQPAPQPQIIVQQPPPQPVVLQQQPQIIQPQQQFVQQQPQFVQQQPQFAVSRQLAF